MHGTQEVRAGRNFKFISLNPSLFEIGRLRAEERPALLYVS